MKKEEDSPKYVNFEHIFKDFSGAIRVLVEEYSTYVGYFLKERFVREDDLKFTIQCKIKGFENNISQLEEILNEKSL